MCLALIPTISCHTWLSSNTSSDNHNIRSCESLLKPRILGKIPIDFGPCVNVHQIGRNTRDMDQVVQGNLIEEITLERTFSKISMVYKHVFLG